MHSVSSHFNATNTQQYKKNLKKFYVEYQKHIEVKRIYEKNLLRGFESLSIHREGGYFPPLRVFLTIPCFIITVGIVRSSLIGERHLSHIFYIHCPH